MLDVMLPNVNLLYLFCRVLVLLDPMYLGRFWTQASPRCDLL